ncbi:MAG: aspartate carbamoyltransferase, partial [Chloroflexota bacterium]|nr:aspartate carbamoyltransferase [Chloroflexota bacterium]
ILHSRVARSTSIALHLLGARVVLCGPPTLLPSRDWLASLPRSDRGGSVEHSTSLPEALRGASVVMALRMQRERQAAGFVPEGEFPRLYGLTRQRLTELAPGALVMHPGPVNQGVELAPDLVAAHDSLISRQVSNGVLVRMAVFDMLLGGDE